MRRSINLTIVLGLSGCGAASSGDDVDTTAADPSAATMTSAPGTGTSDAATTGATTNPTTPTTAVDGSSGGEATTGTVDDSTGEPPAGVLDIYWIDTEGGAATLFAMPEGPLLLVDSGFPGDRDADRIAAVVDELGADAIDVFVVTHYHVDHVGGVPDLVQRVPILSFWDHGDSVEQGSGDGQALWQSYVAVADGLRTTVAPGQVFDVGGVEITIVSAATQVIADALPGAGAANPACDGASNMGPDTSENGNSVGFVARFGSFELLDLGDLTWSYEDQLACPTNRVGAIDLYQTSHHGLAISGATQLVHGIDPVVVVMNNGADKGGEAQTFERIFSAPSQPDLWQQHRAVGNDAQHNAPDDFIANLEGGEQDQGFAIHARVEGGMLTMTNERNAWSQAYQAR